MSTLLLSACMGTTELRAVEMQTVEYVHSLCENPWGHRGQ